VSIASAGGVAPELRASSGDLAALLDEQAIRRVLLRYCRGIDRLDIELVRDCYWPQATDRHGPFTGTRDEFLAWVVPLLRRHTMTMHHIGNMLIDFPADRAAEPDIAVAETYGVAYHSGPPERDPRWNYAAGFRYVDRFERRDGTWRIADRVTAIEWVTPWDADLKRMKDFGDHLPRRDHNDPLYATRTQADSEGGAERTPSGPA